MTIVQRGQQCFLLLVMPVSVGSVGEPVRTGIDQPNTIHTGSFTINWLWLDSDV